MKLQLSRRRIILLVIVLVIILGSGLLLRDFVRQIVQPMLDLGWLIWVQMLTVPQVVFWAAFLLLAISVAGRSLVSGPRRPISGGIFIPKANSISRYQHWQVGLESIPNSPFSRERMERELQSLVMQVLAEQQRIDYEEVRDRQLSGELDLSEEGPAIQGLFAASVRMGYAERAPLLSRLWARLLGRPAPQAVGQAVLDIVGIVAWLEAQTGSRNSIEI